MEATEQAEVVAMHARLCGALADPKRLLIIYELSSGPRTVTELCRTLGLSQSNVSQHLAVLRDRGVVSAGRSGNNVVYRLRGRQVVQALDLLREFMREQASVAAGG
ncbi:MAG TPA: metalloregulator ArsR/SmtB family transcription factor [Acidimicrobiales bacterium]|nr:metalloregulator ArsR/SmtB family transcription factor [Acidimicrobiales bacterium]